MNAIYLLWLRLYTTIKEWFSPPRNQCTHCTPTRAEIGTCELPALPAVQTPIKFNGSVIGTAFNVQQPSPETSSDQNKHFTAASLVFQYDALAEVFLNGVPVGEGQKLAFDISLNGHEDSVYLVSSNAPFYSKRDNEEVVILNNVVLEADWP